MIRMRSDLCRGPTYNVVYLSVYVREWVIFKYRDLSTIVSKVNCCKDLRLFWSVVYELLVKDLRHSMIIVSSIYVHGLKDETSLIIILTKWVCI